MQNDYIDAMIKNLPVLRAATSMTQAQLAEKLGISRQTIVAYRNAETIDALELIFGDGVCFSK